MPNKLINETSPYLLQHAHNPVHWHPWGPEALNKARDENKLILVSVGYSACHWCHVMEHESFENESVAKLMNEYFICIKVDREERPDIDQVYMLAVQLMTGSGGWPLNCICLPDQRPFYGGTYFRTDDWKNLLYNLAMLWKEKPGEAIEYAVRLTEGVRNSEIPGIVEKKDTYSEEDIQTVFEPWKRYLDVAEGGYNRAPKFPLPTSWLFMLRYAHLKGDDAAHLISRLTLQKMAFGGIYDHIGGGFARYSVDGKWHVPHFEKMLYDNSQLVSLYAEGFQYCGDPLYKDVVYETLSWVKREMTSPEGGFYSALDADSEGVEGKFYTFCKDELKEILGDDEELFSIYFNVTHTGNWVEEHTNVFFRKREDAELAELLGIAVSELLEVIGRSKQKVAAWREKRVRPGLDNKILTSWNGLMLKAFTDAYRVFDEREFLEAAIKNASFIVQNLKGKDHSLKRLYKTSYPESGWNGGAFLDDYAFVTEALIALYEATFDENWLKEAKYLADFAIANFFDAETGMFFYTSSSGDELIARKYELMDNVLPSSNSVMAHNLYRLGHLFDEPEFVQMARRMLGNIVSQLKTYPSSYSNWSILLLYEVYGLFEIAITGRDANVLRRELEKNYVPNKILFGGTEGTLPLLLDKLNGAGKIYVCKNRVCQLPVDTINDALKQL